MIRSLHLIMATIHLSQPTMEEVMLKQYAEVVRDEAAKRYIDPYTLVAIGHNESRWIASVIGGRDNLCVGIGQHCLSNYSYCRQDYQSAECQQKKQKLLDGVYNIRETGLRITEWRKFCARKTGHAELHQWLAAYQGYNEPGRGVWCGQKKVQGRWRDVLVEEQTRSVIEYRRRLINLS